MRDNDHINVTLVLKNGNHVDLRIPIYITTATLVNQLRSIFHLEENEGMKQIKVSSKGLILAENQLLYHYPVTDGDIIEII